MEVRLMCMGSEDAARCMEYLGADLEPGEGMVVRNWVADCRPGAKLNFMRLEPTVADH